MTSSSGETEKSVLTQVMMLPKTVKSRIEAQSGKTHVR